MISFTVRMRFRPADREHIAGVLRELTQHSREEPGCVSYIPHQVETDPDLIVIYEQYRDDAAVEHHRETPHFARLATGELYARMVERSVEPLNALI